MGQVVVDNTLNNPQATTHCLTLHLPQSVKADTPVGKWSLNCVIYCLLCLIPNEDSLSLVNILNWGCQNLTRQRRDAFSCVL